MKYNAKQYANALAELCQGQTPSQSGKLIDKWLNLISERGQRSLLPQIVEELESYYHAGSLDVVVESAGPLSKAVKAWAQDYVASRSEAKVIKIREKINPDLLSGIVIKYGDKKIDLSLNQVLINLKESIAN